MKHLQFEFTVDKEAKTVFITREFDASLSQVWDAFTRPELLDQWWGPKPYLSRTKEMNFKVGGRRLYAMVSPEGEERWGLQEYTAIHAKTSYRTLNSFTDKDGNILKEWPSSTWDAAFSEENGITKVQIAIRHQTLEILEKYVEMGFKTGFTVCLQQLEAQLNALK